MTKFSLVSLVLLAGAGACAVGCGSDDDTAPSDTAGTGGKSNAGAGGRSSAGASGKGGAGASDAGASGAQNTEAGAGGEGGVGNTTLYERLGGHDGIAAALDLIIAEELKDPVIVTYFSQQASPSHTPAKKDIAECFTNLLGKAANGPEQYPFTTTSGFTCRNMSAAHATLGIGAGTFDKFVMIAGTVLTNMHVAPDDISAIAGVLNGTKTSIVDPNVPSGLSPCKSPASCSVPVTGEAGAGGATH